jgi:hypothetical protein
MSQDQMSKYLKLLLVLPIPAFLAFSPLCPCGKTHDVHGYHRPNYKQNAGRANRAAHDLVQLAVKKEFQRLDRPVVDNDIAMCQIFYHLSSQKRGDQAILSNSTFSMIKLAVNRVLKLSLISIKSRLSLWSTRRVHGHQLPPHVRTRLRIRV